ncbi:YjcG family protein [Shouchella shacheensis]|uniref:YjcG family protein n=1 Tax=Shouchella shacheensis TaxID=1649580 RepID=UPI00074056F3|nr:YjcG family protein [Shouchella shacheensis]
MNYGIVLFPSKAMQDEANGYRRRYDAHYATIEPHITLKEKFEVSDDALPRIVQAIRQVASDHTPVPIDVYKIDSFYPLSTTIFYKIRENEALVSLYEALHREPFPTEREHRAFIPHLTIAQKLTQDEHADVVGQLKMSDVAHSETIDRMHLLYQLENGSWTVYETFLLKGES